MTLNTFGGLELSGRFRELDFTCDTFDSDVVAAIGRYESPAVAIPKLLKAGAVAALAASTGFDVDSVRRELDQYVAETTRTVQALRDHIGEALSQDGPLAHLLDEVSNTTARAIGEMVSKQGDPDVPQSLTGRLNSVLRASSEQIQVSRDAFTQELRRAAEQQVGLVEKAVREIRDLDEKSALGAAIKRLDDGLAQVRLGQASDQARAEERARGTAKGLEYEDLVSQEVAAVATAHCDHAERTGAQDGLQLLNKRHSKRGDVTCTLDGTDARLVVEAMTRDSTGQTSAAVITELRQAMANRGAGAGIAVVSSADAKFMLGQPIVVLGRDLWAVVLSPDQPDSTALRIAYALARASVLATGRARRGVDLASLSDGVDEIASRLRLLQEVRTQLSNIATGQERATALLTQFEREIKTATGRLQSLLLSEQEVTQAA